MKKGESLLHLGLVQKQLNTFHKKSICHLFTLKDLPCLLYVKISV